MTDEARRIRDAYIERLRLNLRGVSPDVREEIVREIEAHIADALAARGDDSVGAVLDTLDRLGLPELYARDYAIYMMADRGYREWSLQHMLRSTSLWAVTNVVGATVVAIFGILFGLTGLVAIVGLALAVGIRPPTLDLVPSVLSQPVVFLVAAAAMFSGLVGTVRWFVGQYIRRGQPGWTVAGYEDGVAEDWAGDASRRILVVAAAGFGVAVVGGLAAGWLGVITGEVPAALVSIPGLAAVIGIAVLFASPVIGLVWSLRAARH